MTRSIAVVVLGAGRSGTSAATRGLAAVGVDLGDRLRAGWGKNPTGFFEDRDILALNQRLKRILGVRGDSVRLIEPEEWDRPEVVAHRAEAVDTLKRRFGGSPLWGYKYGRTLRFLPFWEAVHEALDLDVQFEDEDLLVINKPAGLVVHPGAGNPDGTLLNGLLHRLPELAALPRLGLVHRLDKDTSGLLIVARSERAHVELTRAMQAREIRREYLAVVKRVMTAGGSVDAAIARHKTDRKKMAVERQAGRGRRAVTHYQVLQRFRSHTSVRVQLETGRTHQIRVHMQHIGHPIAGDPVYGRGVRMPPLHNPASEAVVNAWRRQALHAQSLTFAHPVSGEALVFTAEVPADLQALLDALEKDRRS